MDFEENCANKYLQLLALYSSILVQSPQPNVSCVTFFLNSRYEGVLHSLSKCCMGFSDSSRWI